MTDIEYREMIALAAKAAGWELQWNERSQEFMDSSNTIFNPYEYDQDAFQLAIAARISIDMDWGELTKDGDRVSSVMAYRDGINYVIQAVEPYGTDPNFAVRRAIVRVAAERGKQL